MTSLQQQHSPYPGLQHQGVPQGHMAGMPHAQGQQGQPGPGMPQQMHMGVSGPGGPQVTQAGAMMAGMPPGAGPNAHALQHLNPNQQAQAMFQQQQQQQQQMSKLDLLSPVFFSLQCFVQASQTCALQLIL